MTKHRIQLGVLGVALLSLLALTGLPAKAFVSGRVTVTGGGTMAAGMAFPCTGNGVPDQAKCPPPVGNSNTVAVTVDATATGSIYTALKPKANFGAEAGTWRLQLNGTYTGWCGQASGTLNGTLNPTMSTGTKVKGRGLTLSFVDLGMGWVITGTTTKGETVTGTLKVDPNAAAGSTCLNKAAKSLIVGGHLDIDKPAI